MSLKIVRRETPEIHNDNSLCFRDAVHGFEDLGSLYRDTLLLAKENGDTSAEITLLAGDEYGCSKEESARVAIDEINDFLRKEDMDITLVVSDKGAAEPDSDLGSGLNEYIDNNYVRREPEERPRGTGYAARASKFFGQSVESCGSMAMSAPMQIEEDKCLMLADEECAFDEALSERLEHTEDPFGVYLLYLIKLKGRTNAQVYNKALISKQSFAKLNKDPKKYHPDKLTALQYCVGAELNIDETKDLLARAGYALSPSDKRDIIFSYFITREVFDMIEIDIQMEEHGLPCIIK